jgi:hypothetical protein
VAELLIARRNLAESLKSSNKQSTLHSSIKISPGNLPGLILFLLWEVIKGV